jgi:hypothetical protein
MSKPSKALSIILPDAKPEQLETILLGFAGMEEVHRRLTLVFQAAQGACLSRLQDEYGFSHGNHGTAKTASCGFSSWSTFIQAKFRFSDDKARRLMGVWQGMRPLLEKLSPKEREQFLDFLRRPMLHLTSPEVKVLERLTHKITDAETQKEFLLECGFIKKPHGHSLKNRSAGGGGDDDGPPPLTLEERVQLQLDLFGKFALSVDEVIDRGGQKVHVIAEWPTPKLDEAIAVAKHTLKTLVKVRGTRK